MVLLTRYPIAEPLSRHQRSRNGYDQSGSTFDGESESVADALPQDPARLAAALLLSRAVEARRDDVRPSGPRRRGHADDLPVARLVRAVLAAWGALARESQPGIDAGTRFHWKRKGWVAWCPAESPKRSHEGPMAEEFATAIYQGRHCFGLSADLTWLPGDLVQIADFRMVLPALSGADIAAITGELCSEPPSVSISDDEASALTPRLLRLGRRLGQTADDYVRRLRAVLNSEATLVGARMSTSAVRVDPTLDRLHGMDEAVAWGLTVARDLQQSAEARSRGKMSTEAACCRGRRGA